MFNNERFRRFFPDGKESRLAQQSIESRGTILHHMANLELMINVYIAKFFCGIDRKKIEEMILLVLGDERMSLNAKSQVIYYIATNHDKKWYESYVSVRKHPDKKKKYSFNNDMIYVIEERNIFAHRVMDNGQLMDNIPLPENTLRFTRLKNEFEPLDYTDEKYSEIVTVILHLQYHFRIPLQEVTTAFL